MALHRFLKLSSPTNQSIYTPAMPRAVQPLPQNNGRRQDQPHHALPATPTVNANWPGRPSVHL
ncbi:hypothetical protein COCVIDRAFT_87437 [Bipolaris victoriae FI3]|uniref:Uncharacterized protein n=1 Tax=Bipolaris victoriae (strain FI3) TaxID=930091 RepID=W7EMB2_BIPV3|nr:hypothetical protein COCVIDRAFT_87437 [Bipolaris victoriae FI3]